MNLHDLIIERILFAVDEDVLRDEYHITGELEQELRQLSDMDLLELYEQTVFHTF